MIAVVTITYQANEDPRLITTLLGRFMHFRPNKANPFFVLRDDRSLEGLSVQNTVHGLNGPPWLSANERITHPGRAALAMNRIRKLAGILLKTAKAGLLLFQMRPLVFVCNCKPCAEKQGRHAASC